MQLKNLFKYLRIDRKYTFPGDMDELMDRMDHLQGDKKYFRTEAQPANSYKIIATFSLGTLQVTGRAGATINVLMNIDPRQQENPEVHLSSKVRVEQYFLLLIFAIFLIGDFAGGFDLWYTPLITFGIFVICHLWFHMVYRVQENSLIRKLILQLELEELK